MRGLWLGVHCGTPRPPRRMRADPPAASVRLTSARTETGGSGNRRAVRAFLLCAWEFDVFSEHASGARAGHARAAQFCAPRAGAALAPLAAPAAVSAPHQVAAGE